MLYSRVLYKSAERLSPEGVRSRYVISQSFDIIVVEFESLYSEPYVAYYKKYPPVPRDFEAPSENVKGMSEAAVFLYRLHCNKNYKPYRVDKFIEL
ncbi:MAG: hypothetical protein E7660_05615 [Ruminococcaceae bacterium]|nr:hypothetical protein [Oscillospiraceae bacterium]